MKLYIAAGWFSPIQAEELSKIEEITERLGFEVASPRKIFVCPPNATQNVQKNTFDGNLEHIRSSDFVIVNTRDKDLGTIFEAGVAYETGVPIVYFAQGLKGNFNLMLSQSGVKVCTSYDELEAYLRKTLDFGHPPYEEYSGAIE